MNKKDWIYVIIAMVVVAVVVSLVMSNIKNNISLGPGETYNQSEIDSKIRNLNISLIAQMNFRDAAINQSLIR